MVLIRSLDPSHLLLYLRQQLAQLGVGGSQAIGEALAFISFHAVKGGVNSPQSRVDIVNVVDKANQFSSGCHENALLWACRLCSSGHAAYGSDFASAAVQTIHSQPQRRLSKGALGRRVSCNERCHQFSAEI